VREIFFHLPYAVAFALLWMRQDPGAIFNAHRTLDRR
jgi:hypothetical protein